jgi:hypothetical protein
MMTIAASATIDQMVSFPTVLVATVSLPEVRSCNGCAVVSGPQLC